MDEMMLEREALRLPPRERAMLADALLESLEDDASRAILAAWAEEAEDRLAAYHRNEMAAHDGAELLSELRAGRRK